MRMPCRIDAAHRAGYPDARPDPEQGAVEFTLDREGALRPLPRFGECEACGRFFIPWTDGGARITYICRGCDDEPVTLADAEADREYDEASADRPLCSDELHLLGFARPS